MNTTHWFSRHFATFFARKVWFISFPYKSFQQIGSDVTQATRPRQPHACGLPVVWCVNTLRLCKMPIRTVLLLQTINIIVITLSLSLLLLILLLLLLLSSSSSSLLLLLLLLLLLYIGSYPRDGLFLLTAENPNDKRVGPPKKSSAQKSKRTISLTLGQSRIGSIKLRAWLSVTKYLVQSWLFQ